MSNQNTREIGMLRPTEPPRDTAGALEKALSKTAKAGLRRLLDDPATIGKEMLTAQYNCGLIQARYYDQVLALFTQVAATEGEEA